MLNLSSSTRTRTAWILIGLITFLIGLQIRLYPYVRNVSSDAYEEGTLLVLAKIRATVTARVNEQFPNMSAEKKALVINAKVNEILRKDNAQARKAFDQVGLALVKRSGDHKHYLLESDSYYFLDLTENVIEKGAVSAQIKGSRYFNPLMLAPLGFWDPHTWHPYVGAMVYKIVKVFDPTTDVMSAVAWTSIVLLPLVVAAFLYACWAAGCGWLSSFIASVFFVLSPIYLQRSTYAWYDTDTYTILFPVLALAFLFRALATLTNRKKSLVYGILCITTIALFSRFWSGWGFLWGLILASLVGLTVKSFLRKDPLRRTLAAQTALMLGLTFVFVALMVGLPQVLDMIRSGYGELQKFTMPRLKDWPDLFIVVGELKNASLFYIANSIGGLLVFFGAIAALLWSLGKALRHKTFPPDMIMILAFFFAVSIVLASGAERFTIIVLTPASLLFACGLEEVWNNRKALAEKCADFHLSKKTAEYLLSGVLILLIIIPVATSQATIRSLLSPIFNSAWERALTKVREQTPPDSIVDTWWAPGHFVKAIAKRRVNFDGATIRGEQAYWLTRVYLSRNERDALGILRMINTSSNEAAEYLQSLNMPLSEAVPLLLEVTRHSRAEAQKALRKILPEKNVERILQLTHGTPPPSYLLVYHENVVGNSLLAYVGKWNFAKIEALNKDPEKLKKVPKKGSKDYIAFLWDLVGGPYRESDPLNAISKDGSRVLFNREIVLDTSAMTVEINSPRYGRGIPQSIVYYDGMRGEVVEKPLDHANLSYSIVFLNDPGLPRVILMDRELANSLLMKLYYFDGKGLRYFKPFAKEQDLSGRTKIFIYEVSWPKDF